MIILFRTFRGCIRPEADLNVITYHAQLNEVNPWRRVKDWRRPHLNGIVKAIAMVGAVGLFVALGCVVIGDQVDLQLIPDFAG